MDEKIVEISQKAIYLGGKPLFLLSAEMHYYTLESSKWQEYILSIKENGFNAISIYIPWAFHEGEEGKIDFDSPQKNIYQIFDMCKKLGIFVLIRPGPRTTLSNEIDYFPPWLLSNYPEILDVDVNGNTSVFEPKGQKIITQLHPIYLAKVKLWYENVSTCVIPHQFPEGNIILWQIDDEFTFNVKDQNFAMGYHPIYLMMLQDFLKKKYLIIQALNEIYGEHYLTFEEIKPPIPPKNIKINASEKLERSVPFEVLPYLDWLEFKEWIISEFISILTQTVRENEIIIPIYLNIASYKSPINTQQHLTHDNVLYEGSNVMMGFNFLPNVFHSQVNVNCFTSWHVEWLKSHFHNPPFIAKFQEYHENQPYKQLNTHILTKLSLAHGIRAISFNTAKELESERTDSPLRFQEIKKFQNLIDTNENVIRSLSKSYDPLSVAYYHPYTRLKSIGSSYNSLNFGFPIDYDLLKYNYKNYLQLLTKFFIHYDVIDLHQITGEELTEKPYIMLYYLGWMEHETMVLLQEYVESGGTIISFGDIPTYNEYFEEDRTLYSIYFAKVLEEKEVLDVKWVGREQSEPILHINKLYTYNLEFPQNAHVLAHSDNPPKIHAFSREYRLGRIIHSGIMVSSDIESTDMLSKLFEEVIFPTKNVSASQECVVIQNVAPNEERFITVGNLNPTPQKSISFNLYNPKGKKFPKNLEIDQITIPPYLFSTWQAYIRLSSNLVLRYCTAEVRSYTKSATAQDLTLRFPILANYSEKQFSGKISFMYKNEEMKIIPLKGNIKINFGSTNENSYKDCTIEFIESNRFSFNHSGQTFTFNIQEEIIEN